MIAPIHLKRTLTPDMEPEELAVGEVALGLGNDPVRIWIGTPDGVKEFTAHIRELEQRIAVLEAKVTP
jgi:hypothetical protein